jgi:acyl carrier protein
MDHDQAEKLIVELLAQRFGVAADKLKPEARLFDDLELDSIDALDMLALLQKQHRIKVDEEQARRIRTVADAVRYVLTNQPG